MFCMTLQNLKDIHYGIKIGTLRPIKTNGKGYFLLNSTQRVKKGMFDSFYYFKVRITGVDFVDIEELSIEEFQQLGYKSKAEYMAEPFNQKNNSTKRVRYFFEVIETNTDKINELLEELQ